ncbi:hypothetical protein FACS1894109_16230 [Spirochaetia bacterium]|nr:hypothetical protein FACS1894109_16230 [Spirochaetia bacterium]
MIGYFCISVIIIINSSSIFGIPISNAVLAHFSSRLIYTILYLIHNIYFLAFIVPSIAVFVRRIHDVDKSGWFILIPIYNLILAVAPGTNGTNRYGSDPKNQTGMAANPITSTVKLHNAMHEYNELWRQRKVYNPSTFNQEHQQTIYQNIPKDFVTHIPPSNIMKSPSIINTAFVDILKTITDERGLVILENHSKCRALLQDYIQGEYKKESRLLLQAIESGCPGEIIRSQDVDITKQKLINKLCDEYSIDKEAAGDIINLLYTVINNYKGEKQ